MKTPPFLLGASLVFWGWQTDLFVVGALMALVLESSRYVKARWEFSDEDFSRIWTVCTLLFLGIAVYAFTDNGGPARFSNFFQNPGPSTQSSAGVATSRTASIMLRWLPMVLFLFVTAQAFSARQEIPIATISLIMRRRWQKAVRLGRPLPAMRGMNVSYPYFAVCLFAASVHSADDNSYFWGFAVLATWALWAQRVRRFALPVWGTILILAFGAGYYGQEGISRIQNYIQNMDPQWFERFVRRQGTDPTQSQTHIGRIGQLKLSGRIVIRLQPEAGSVPPEYLREASYRIYERTSWRANHAREPFNNVSAETNNGAFVLIGKTNYNAVKIASFLSGVERQTGAPLGLLPLPSGVGQLDQLPAFVVKMNNLGAVLVEGPGLVTFVARFGPGPTIDAPFRADDVQAITNSTGRSYRRERRERAERVVYEANPDLAVPPGETNALDDVIAQLGLKYGDRSAAMRAIDGFFTTNFTYSTWLDLPDAVGANQTPLEVFLTRTRRGHCEYFATATVLLLRRLGIPARYAVGYSVHEESGSGYVVRLRDAHAWCLVWNERLRIWQDFDTTPASWVGEEAKHASPFQKLSDLWTWVGFQFSKFRWGQSNARQYMLLALVPVTGLLVYQVFFRRKRRRKAAGGEAEWNDIWPGLDSEFYLIEQRFAGHGLKRRDNEPLTDWLERVGDSEVFSNVKEQLQQILRLHYRHRFDPCGLPAAERSQLRDAVGKCLRELKRGLTESARS